VYKDDQKHIYIKQRERLC